MSLPRIAIGSLGGTISMTPDAAAGGVVPRLGAAELIASVPGLGAVADISAHTLFQLPSASIDIPQVLAALAWAKEQVESGAHGVVLTQGTDSIEETAYLLDLYWPCAQPLVVTGAMRAAAAAGAEGPANLLGAAITAASAASRGRGVLVVMNDEIHHARWVRKNHSLAVQAFVSPEWGPVGRIVEGRARYLTAAVQRPTPLPWPIPQTPAPAAGWPRVALLETWLGDDGLLAELAVQQGYDGLVIAGFGAGHVSFAFAERLDTICARVPVVLASRTAAGPTTQATYGYVGSEIDAVRRGALMSGWLPARKARLLLCALLAQQTPRASLAEVWHVYTQALGGDAG